jgi:hydroxymethylpyrimidine/phosphomethylpyrimidine kinase
MLAKGEDLETAVRLAKIYISAAIAAADRLAVGHGTSFSQVLLND